MDWQQVTALCIVALTAALFVHSALGARRKRGCGIGCSAPSGRAETGSIKLCARKGERPRVIVKLG